MKKKQFITITTEPKELVDKYIKAHPKIRASSNKSVLVNEKALKKNAKLFPGKIYSITKDKPRVIEVDGIDYYVMINGYYNLKEKSLIAITRVYSWVQDPKDGNKYMVIYPTMKDHNLLIIDQSILIKYRDKFMNTPGANLSTDVANTWLQRNPGCSKEMNKYHTSIKEGLNFECIFQDGVLLGHGEVDLNDPFGYAVVHFSEYYLEEDLKDLPEWKGSFINTLGTFLDIHSKLNPVIETSISEDDQWKSWLQERGKEVEIEDPWADINVEDYD